MPYKLKPQYESFTVVDGPFARKTFDHSTEYEAIPPGEKGKFERVEKTERSPAPQPKKSEKTGSRVAGEAAGQKQ